MPKNKKNIFSFKKKNETTKKGNKETKLKDITSLQFDFNDPRIVLPFIIR